MIQDIYPSRLDNSYKNLRPEAGDYILIFNEEGKVYVGDDDGIMSFLSFSGLRSALGGKAQTTIDDSSFIYLFSVDERRYFLLYDHDFSDKDIFNKDEFSGFSWYTIREVRDRLSLSSDVDIFVVFTAYHLWKWYADNKCCGKCGAKLIHSELERALTCPDCKNVIYPRINPAVIVGVTKDDQLLLTRYRRGYAHNALVAGFTEIGETLEETVAREVMEETGVKVKNIRYYKSQPWGMAQDILVGFYCDADGEGKIRMDENELKYAEWVSRADIELQPNNLSLTNEMMRMFKEGMV